MATKPQVKKPTNGTSKAVAFVAANALSLNVGEEAVVAFKDQKAKEAAAAALTSEAAVTRGATLKKLTLAFVKAATADPTIVLKNIQSDESKSVDTLKLKLEVAVGIKTATQQPDGTTKFDWAPWTAAHWPQPGESKETAEGQKRETFRSNFSTMFKKAMQAAHGVHLKGMQLSEDKASGALMISGKGVKERFGEDTVLINEKKEIKEGDRKVTLKKIPSFTELARISSESVGKTMTTRADSRAKQSGPLTEKDVIASVQALQLAITKFKGFSDDLANALEGLQDTIETALSNNEGSEAA